MEVCAVARDLLEADTVACFEVMGEELELMEVAGAPFVGPTVLDIGDTSSTVASVFRGTERAFLSNTDEFDGAASVLAAPIVRGADRCGVLLWMWRRPRRRLSSYETTLVEMLAGEKGLAVERHHLLRRQDPRVRPGVPARPTAVRDQPPLVELGLREALDALARAVSERGEDIELDAQLNLTDAVRQGIRPAVVEAVHYVIRGTLDAALDDAGAQHIQIVVSVDDDLLTATLTHDGRGIRSDDPVLTAARRRAELVGGQLELAGTSALLSIPGAHSADVLAGRRAAVPTA